MLKKLQLMPPTMPKSHASPNHTQKNNAKSHASLQKASAAGKII
jgi:hypothetical protein